MTKVAVTCLCVQVYKNSPSGPEITTDSWAQVPADAIKVFKKCRYAGQPLVHPSATTEEIWVQMDDIIAEIAWHLTGRKEGELDNVRQEIKR
jgi:hypothetical protein